MRILLVGNPPEARNGAHFFDTNSKLVSGFTRNGHLVLTFNERDVARNATPLRSKVLGAGVMNRRLLRMVENFAPELVVLAHADLVTRQTLEAIRATPDRPRVAVRNIDLLALPRTVENIRRHAGLVDAIFVTTAGEPLRQFSAPDCAVAFIPNAVTPGVESGRCFENASPTSKLFYATGDSQLASKTELCREIRRRLPELKVDFRGIDGIPPVFGIDYVRAITNSRMGLSLDKQVFGNLYSSDRLAQYVGNGLLTFVHRDTGYGALFSDEELAFYDDLDDLVRLLAHYDADDEAARSVARNGWKRYHDIFNADLVTRYLVEVTFRQPLSQDYAWPTETY